jgi:hypothetical protein
MNELDRLRAELRDVRYLTEAVLIALVGDGKFQSCEQWARLSSIHRRERRGTPLRDFIPDRLVPKFVSTSRGMDLATLEELAGQPRERITAIPGLGRKTMQKLDAAMAERGLNWAVAP